MSQTTRELLENMSEFHDELSEFYEKMSCRVNNPRVKMLLDYMSNREENLCEGLISYRKTTCKEILGFNIKYTPEIDTNEWFKEVEVAADMNVDDLLKVLLSFDDHLIDYYHRLATEAESEGVSDLFKHLVKMEERERKLAALNANEVSRM